MNRFLIQVYGVDQWGRVGWLGKPYFYSPTQAQANEELTRLKLISTPSLRLRVIELSPVETGEFSEG